MVSPSKREKILRSAEFLFSSMDFENVTMRRIAKQANVSPALIVYYFESKESLLEQVICEHIPRVENAFNKLRKKEKITLNDIVLAYFNLWKLHPKIPVIVARQLLHYNHADREKNVNSRFLLHSKDVFKKALLRIDGYTEDRFEEYSTMIISLSIHPFLSFYAQESGFTQNHLNQYEKLIQSTIICTNSDLF